MAITDRRAEKKRLPERARKASGGFVRAVRVSAIIVPAVLYTAFLNGVPESFPGVWIKTILAISALYFVLSVFTRSLLPGAGSYFIMGLAVATLASTQDLSWLRMAYIPYVFLGPLVFGGWGALAFAASVPLFEARSLMHSPGIEQWALVSFAALAGIMGFVSLMRRERSVREKPRQREIQARRAGPVMPQADDGYDVASPVDMDGLMREDDESLRELLRITVFATRASGVSLFVLSGDRLRLRCTSAGQSSDTGMISPVPMWYINDAHRARHTIVTGNLGAETTQGFINRAAPLDGDILVGDHGEEEGYEGQGEAASVAAAPVFVGNTFMGVLAVNSSRSNAFRGNTVTVLELLSSQVARTLSGGRVVAETERTAEHHRLVLEESSKLATSIDLREISTIVTNVMAELSEMDVRVYVRTPSGYALIRQSGNPEAKAVKVSFEGTLSEVYLDGSEPMYFSSLREVSKPLLPDHEVGEFGSALLLPLISEGEGVGLVALTSEDRDSLKAETINLLDLLGRHAAISLKNSLTHKDTQVKAATDALTGLNNRRSFMNLLETEHTRFERTGMKYAIIMMDVDFFKKVNDTYGHQAGDEVLREVASLMRESFRATDYLGRYGGEEFAAVLVNSDRMGAHRLAERMRHATEIKRMDTSAGPFSVTMSLGIALAEEGMEPEEVLKRADEALYRAKKSGRNRTEFWG